MTWGRLDDGFHDHPKVEVLSLDAIGLWTLCWSYANRHRKTSPQVGFVSEARARGEAAKRGISGRRFAALVAELTTPLQGRDHGLWEHADGGWLLHDYEQYLPKQRDPEELAEAGRRGGQARAKRQAEAKQTASYQLDGSQAVIQESSSKPEANQVANPSSRASSRAYPSRPVPEESSNPEGERPETQRASPATKPPPDAPSESRCAAHRDITDPPPCAGCKAAREHAQRRADVEADRAARELEARARACTRCDGAHITDQQGRPTRQKCDHRRTA